MGMTREEHIIYAKNLRTALNMANNFSAETMESLDAAIKALEQEPCENAISRQAVIDEIFRNPKNFYNEFDQGFFADKIRDLPSVTPQPKTGHWIVIDDCERFIAKCSECGEVVDSRMISKYPYCHCGAKMQGVEE